MAVITRFIVVRNGVELDKVFDVKKEAEAYDRMLDAAENLAGFIKKSDLDLGIDETVIDTLCVYLSQNAPEVTQDPERHQATGGDRRRRRDVPLPDDLRARHGKKEKSGKRSQTHR